MASKGSRYRKVKWQEFGNDHDKIFGAQDYESSKEERLREPERDQYIESYKSIECGTTDFQEGRLRYAEYSIQYNATTENN